MSAGAESGCSEDEGMCVTKYSWKQRRWRADGAIEDGAESARVSAARLQVRQATAGLLDAVERRTVGFHMLSLAAKDASCCKTAIMSW